MVNNLTHTYRVTTPKLLNACSHVAAFAYESIFTYNVSGSKGNCKQKKSCECAKKRAKKKKNRISTEAEYKDGQTILGCVRMCVRWDIFQRKREKQKNWNYRLSNAAPTHCELNILYSILCIYIYSIYVRANTVARIGRACTDEKAENHGTKKIWLTVYMFISIIIEIWEH